MLRGWFREIVSQKTANGKQGCRKFRGVSSSLMKHEAGDG